MAEIAIHMRKPTAWARATFDPAGEQVTFYESDDGEVWRLSDGYPWATTIFIVDGPREIDG